MGMLETSLRVEWVLESLALPCNEGLHEQHLRKAQQCSLCVHIQNTYAGEMCAPIKPKILCDCQMTIIWVKIFHF